MRSFIAWLWLLPLGVLPAAHAQDPDLAIHEELRTVLREVQSAINAGQYERMLPYLDPKIEATSMTQEVMGNRADVMRYFEEWFGPAGYMKKVDMKLEADTLTELDPGKTWGLVRGKGLEHYEAKDGDQFDFVNRWTAVLVKNDDGKWRLRAIHFGTNNLDNPVLTKVKNTLVRNGIIGAVAALVVGAAAGYAWGRRRPPA